MIEILQDKNLIYQGYKLTKLENLSWKMAQQFFVLIFPIWYNCNKSRYFLKFLYHPKWHFSQKHAFIRFASKSQDSDWTGSKEFSTQWTNCAFYCNSSTCMSVNVCFLCWKDILETWTLQYKFLILCFIHTSNLGLYVQF